MSGDRRSLESSTAGLLAPFDEAIFGHRADNETGATTLRSPRLQVPSTGASSRGVGELRRSEALDLRRRDGWQYEEPQAWRVL